MSGSPVMFHTDPARGYRRDSLPTDPNTGLRIAPYLLIGILVGTWHGQYITDFLPEKETVLLTDAEFNSGISVVLPASHIIETLYQEQLRNNRNASLEAIEKLSGYKPLSK
jgi:hypothetical protein